MRLLPNLTIMRCSACESECKMRLAGVWRGLSLLVFMALCQLVVWSRGVSYGWGFLLVLVLSFPFNEAEKRLYHTYWAWRHPTRCQGGGHVEPEAAA